MTKPNIQLRISSYEDIPILKHWDQQEHVLFATGNDSNQFQDPNYWDHELSLCDNNLYQYYIATLDNNPIASVLIIDPALEPTHYWGTIDEGYRAIDIRIGESQNIGKGYGTIIMELVLDKCFEKEEVKGVYIDPLSINLRAIKFYQKLGFEFIENRNFGEDNCDVYFISKQKYLTLKDL
jgi:aminoglycoside 6'-N-acetyltransferase